MTEQEKDFDKINDVKEEENVENQEIEMNEEIFKEYQKKIQANILPFEHNKKREFDINFHSFRLLQKEPFFSALSRSITKVKTRSIPTAGVCVNPHTCNFELFYNPDFFEGLGQIDENGIFYIDPKKTYSLEEKKELQMKIIDRREIEIAGILEHEFYHLIFDHVTGRLPVNVKENKPLAMLWNFATDLAINQELVNQSHQKLPYGCLVPGKDYKDPLTGKIDSSFKDYPTGLIAEGYFEMLKKDPRAQKMLSGEGQGEGFGNKQTLDDHSMWCGEGSEKAIDSVSREIAKERLKDAIAKAVNEGIQGGRGWGTISAAMQKEILRRLKSVVDWKAVLRYFVKVSQKASKTSSIKKINKRFPYIHAGKKTNRMAHIAVSIDQSGSVSDQMLVLFFSELNKLSDIANFTVIPFDDRVFEEKIYVWKKGENRKWERVLCGGTNFDAPTDYVNAHSFDGHIICTDLCAPKPKNSKCQRVWLTSQSYANQPYFQTNERLIIIPDRDIQINES